MKKAILINGSHTEYSRLTGIQQEVEKQLTEQGFETTILFIHQLPAEDLIRANFSSEAIIHAVNKVENADVVVLLTPIFKASYSGILKTFLDLLPQDIFLGKSVFPVAIGGSISHLLAIEYALKPVVSALGATHITKPVYVVDQLVEKLDNGQYVLAVEVQQRIAQQIEMVVQSNYIKINS